jgi:hypothetical protein
VGILHKEINVKTKDDLKDLILRIDGRGYRSIKIGKGCGVLLVGFAVGEKEV